MFNLESAISEWRRQMLAAGIKTPVPMEELENHLRDGVEQNVKSGMSEPQAFEAAARQVGQAGVINAEFKKTTGRLPNLIILAALFGSVFGGAMVLPALAHLKHKGILPVGPILIGLLLVVGGGGVALYCIQRRKQGRGKGLVTAGIMLACAFYMVPLIQVFFIRNATLDDWIVCGFLAAASVLFYGTCLRRHLSPPTRKVS